MALGDTLNQATDATSGVQDQAGGAVAKADAAKGDVAGDRRGTQNPDGAGAGAGDDDDEDDRIKKNKEKPSSLKIHIKLNLDVEVHLTARVKGDIEIGLL